MRYELHYNRKVIAGTPDELRRLAATLKCYWELHVYISSSMRTEEKHRMNIVDMREALRLKERGYTNKSLAKKYHVCPDYMGRVLVQMKSETL